MGIQGVARVTGGYKGLQGVTGGYKELQGGICHLVGPGAGDLSGLGLPRGGAFVNSS